MATVMKEFIDRFAQMEKLANETLAADPAALVGVDNIPGSEHDAKVPASAKESDKEVAQGQPAGATTADGAVNGGDAKPLNEGKLEVDQPLENPEKKPLISDDALTAKEASSHLDKLVGELLSDIKGAQKKAAAKPAEPAKPAEVQKQAQDASAAEKPAEPEKPTEPAEKKAEPGKPTLNLDAETLSKIAAATATFMAGRKAAEDAIEKKAAVKNNALALIKAACIKDAQESGLDPATAAAAADNAMAAAGMPAGEVAAADAGAAAADAGAAAADAGAAADVEIPQDVTEEELGAAIVDLVQSGQLDADTAKALVDEIAGDAGGADGEGAGMTEDQAAEIIADGLQSGEITPEQAKSIIGAIESGAGTDAGAAAEAAGAADAAAAAQEAADEAKGAADAENAIKQAAAQLRKDTITKVASAIAAKRQQVKEAEAAKTAKEEPKGLLNKVASILQKRKDAFDAKANEAEKKAAANPSSDDRYLAGFRKQAEAMGVDPVILAKYVIANKERFAKAEK